jgi:EryCIII-like glycosyltransferase
MSAASVFPAFADEEVEFLAAGAELPDFLGEVERRIGVNLLEGIVPAAVGEGFGGVRVDMSLDESLTVARSWRPDLIISEACDLVGPLVAAILGVPTAMVTLGPDLPAELTDVMYAAVDKRYAARGLTRIPPMRILDICPPSLQRDNWEKPEGWTPLRPEAHRAPGDATKVEAAQQRAGRPRLLVTFGTIFGDPLVVTPQGADQYVQAEQVASAGAGIGLPLGNTTPADVVKAVEEVLGDPSYRAGARRIADQIAAMPSPDDDAATLAAALA